MVWEILPAIGAAVPLTVYVLKKDGNLKRRLEADYGELVKRDDLTVKGMAHYANELESVRSVGVRSFLKKREYTNILDNKIIAVEMGRLAPTVKKLIEH